MSTGNAQSASQVDSIVMRRFAVFAGPCYYASGGFHDYVGSFDTLEDAVAVAAATHQIHPEIDRQADDFEWWHIFDMTERKIVRRSECQGYGAPNDGPTLDVIVMPDSVEEIESQEPRCQWTADELHGYYRTGCGQGFISSDDGSLKDSGFVFCIYCGRRIDETSQLRNNNQDFSLDTTEPGDDTNQ